MYLKSIEMQGFKSFADKTKVVFDQGVTAVVGPNGSGKSNITESLRWALGESSAKSLRGGKMPDVIFAGTATRKPLNYASVIVTLDNSKGFIANQGKEIRVERHIYRSGDSEYLIDGKKVRLKDIHDLFMDTGLGRDSFSIISQGRVEAIFNAKPEERRAIFEEAAGVLKYKTRKKETESKLKQTQDNLDRLEDIIYELEHQLAPLEKQAQVARQFQELDSQREGLYLDVLVAQIQKGKLELTQAEEQLRAVKEDLALYYKERNQLEEENQSLKTKRHQVSDQLQSEQARLLDLTKLLSDVERRIDLHRLESSQNESSRQDAQERLELLGLKKETIQTQLVEKEELLSSGREQLGILQEHLADLDGKLAHFSETPEQIMEHLRETYVQMLHDEAEVSNQLTKAEQELEAQIKLQASQSDELERLSKETARVQEEEVRSREELASAQAVLRALLDEYQEGQIKLDDLKTAYQTEQEQMFDLLDQMKNKKARQTSLEAIIKSHSNFYAGVRAVLQEAKSIGGIVGAVSEHISFAADYQTAMEVALGAASQHVIVEDEGAAKRAIAFLKQHRQGRATFLPLTRIKERSLADYHIKELTSSPGFLGVASELVRYDQRLASIFQNLLGVTAIFDTLEHANQAARATKFQVRLVTLDGSEIRPGGAFAGGAHRQQSTTFIKPELDALVAEIEVLSRHLVSKEERVAALKEDVLAQEASLLGIKEKGEAQRLVEQKAALHHERILEEWTDLKKLYTLQLNQSDEVGLDQLTSLKESLESQLLDLDKRKVDILAEIEEVKTNRDAIQEKVASLQDEKAGAKLEIARLQSQQGFEEENVRRLEGELALLLEEESLLNELISQKIEALEEQDLVVLEGQLGEVAARKEASSQAQIRLQFELEDIEAQLEELTERLGRLGSKNEGFIRQQTSLEANVTHISQALRHLLTQLTEQYKMSIEEASQQAKPLENLAHAEKELKDLERAIRALGPVNLDAIEQYQEVASRLDFLQEQRTDVLSARDLLLATIHEMDAEVIERFTHTFGAIRESFKHTFTQMFGGGSADLLLTSDDILTAGVEISVQPPGKKIQSLHLMSGGEKALSALALLFSIIRVKTIPFVILDEVEAALDEANVKRFGDYLNRFDKASQFIVVTHRKGTMSAADAIYGVTMQESGVSKIVSVKLKDLEKNE